MNFNVHRRNKSLVTQSSFRQKKEGKSLKKMNNTNCAENLMTEAKEIYQSQGDLTEAVRLFLQYLTLNPWNSQALYLCAVCQIKIGQYQSAVSHLIVIPDDYPQKANSILLHAMALNKLGKTTQSLQIINECIRRYQNFEEAICFRGKLYMTLSYYHRAEQDFKTLISKTSCSFLPHNSLGDCYRSQGKPDKALGPYLKAIQILQSFQVNKDLKKQVFLKIGICLYQLERWREAKCYIQQAGKYQQNQSCQYHYYLGGALIKLAERQKGLLHLQYCLRTQGSSKLMKKAYKKLIQLYLQNYQFYEALNIARLGEIVNLQIEGWDRVVGAFMLIIKGSFEQGLVNLNEIYSELKQEQLNKRLLKIKRDSSQEKPSKQSRYNEKIKIEKKLFAASPVKMSSRDKELKSKYSHKKMGYFSTKSVIRAVPKIQSMRHHQNLALKKQEQLRLKTDCGQKQVKKQLYNGKQKEFMYPLVLLFKAYSEFFTAKYMQCLDTYDQYQNFIRDVLGKDSDVTYNKTLCQGLLMAQSDMEEEALTKYSTCIDIYYQKNGLIPVQPLLYKIVLLVRLALQQTTENQKIMKLQEATSTEILQSTIEMMDNYHAVLNNHSLALYFRGLVYLLLNRYQQSRQWLQKTLKIAEDCSWKCLWIKGVVELKMGNYYEAVKQFSAGLILENRAQLYLGRSISFLLLTEQAQKGMITQQVKTLMRSVHLGEINKSQKQPEQRSQGKKKSDSLIQNCFEDLQKYIELQTSQEDISLWVSKILFRNKAYDQAIRSLRKIRNTSQQIDSMVQSIEIYEGNFQKGGEIGMIIKSAFDGTYMSREQESHLLHSEVIHDKKLSWYLQENQKWMVIIHLYVTENYSLLLKYLQKQLFSQLNSKTMLLLRYNIMIAYFLLGQHKKAVNSCRALLNSTICPTINKIVKKIEAKEFDKDECLQDLKEDLGLSCSKLLSNYLPFRSIFIDQQNTIKIYVRPNIPFPQFPAPEMNLVVSSKLISSQIVSNAVEKKLEAPWIRKTENKTVQFMQKLQESGVYLTGETSSLKESGSQPFLL